MKIDIDHDNFFKSTTSEQYQEYVPVTLQYDTEVLSKFKIMIIILFILAVITPLTVFHGTGWNALLLVAGIILTIYYLKRIKRIVSFTDKGVAEKAFWRDRFWKYSEIDEIVDIISTQSNSTPSRRIILEHSSTHDIAIDDQMEGFDEAVLLIKEFWMEKFTKRLTRKHVSFFILKYW